MSEIKKIIVLFIIIILTVILIPNLDNSYIMSDKLYINEIMANNTYSHKDNDGKYSDYIEIYNGYKYKINLEGYHLSDSEYETNKWTFPSITINPGEYLVIYASGKDECDLKKRICHTNFKLSSKGETLTLSDKRGNIINKFTYPNSTNDISYGYVKRKYNFMNNPTPKKKNSSKIKYQKISNDEIFINEYIVSNKQINYNSNGEYNDFVELYNISMKDIKLENIYLTDDENNLTKYKLPTATIRKNNFLLIYLSEKSFQALSFFLLIYQYEFIVLEKCSKFQN